MEVNKLEVKKIIDELKDVRLVAATKYVGIEEINKLEELGVKYFGENRVQALLEKYEKYDGNCEFHMIGTLQANKVKYIIDKVCMIHSVDSYRLAEEINIQAKKSKRIVPILIEVNIASEETKFGIPAEEAAQLAEEISKLDALRIKGLMAIAPYVENPENNRHYFRKIRELSVDIARQNIDNVTMGVLSMGMTNDYTTAIEEGATIVRVGTGIFGARLKINY